MSMLHGIKQKLNYDKAMGQAEPKPCPFPAQSFRLVSEELQEPQFCGLGSRCNGLGREYDGHRM